MKQMLVCNACGAHLTGALVVLSGKDPSVPLPEPVDREPLTPQGTAYKSYEPMVRSYGETKEPLEFVPQYWVNPEDLCEGVRLTKRWERLNGCCGLDGMGGPNQLCACGAEVGTLRSDCWTPLVFIPEPKTTRWTRIEDWDEPQ